MMIVRHIAHMVIAIVIAIGAGFIVSEAVEHIVENERRKKAIVNDWQGLNWRMQDGWLVVDVYGVKNKECLFIKDYQVSAVAYVGGVPREVNLAFLDDTTPGSTRPVGAQSFGAWGFKARDGLRIDRGPIVTSVAHICARSDEESPPVPVISSITLTYG